MMISHSSFDSTLPENYHFGVTLAQNELKNTELDMPENHTLLLQHAEFADKICLALTALKNANLISQKNFEALLEQSCYADLISNALLELKEATQENYTILLTHAENAEGIVRGFNKLQEYPALAQQLAKNKELFAKNGKYAYDIIFALDELQHARLVNQNNYEILIQHAAKMSSFPLAFATLRNTQPSLQSQDTFNTLIRYRDFLRDISQKMLELQPLTQVGFNNIIDQINQRNREEKTAFFSASNQSLGANSPAKLFFHSECTDPKNLAPLIFDFLNKPRI